MQLGREGYRIKLDLRRFTTRQVNFMMGDGLLEIVLEVKYFSKNVMIGRTVELGQG